MISLILAIAIRIAPAPVTQCETYAPRLDGISVTVCDGHAVRYSDAAGNVLEVAGN
jgi:hypothetical protein